MIRLTISSIDGFRRSYTFKSLEGARKRAQRHLGENPEFGSHYAISDDGVVKAEVEGCNLADLFPARYSGRATQLVDF